VLEAAHISPYRGPEANHRSHGHVHADKSYPPRLRSAGDSGD
jgi:hypothetical protein